MREAYNISAHRIDPYEELANAIIVQAVEDYTNAKRKLKKDPDNYNAHNMLTDCKIFFNSNYIHILTDLDIKLVLSKLDNDNLFVCA